MNPVPDPLRRGSALIITLILLSLVTILLVGFSLSMHLDLITSASHFDRVEGDLYARMGVDAGQSQLCNAIGSTNAFWISQPGRLVSFPGGASTPVDLSSGAASASASSDQAADLNPRVLFGEAGNLIASTNLPMRAAWIYMKQDGTYAATAPPAYDAANPVVGRFAYWVDDESARINLNTAWTRGTQNTNGVSHPSRVELSGLFNGLLSSGDADLVSAGRAASPYGSPQDARRAGGGVTNALAEQAFSFTHYSHSPDQNMFGQPRILLTTQQAVAAANGTTNFLDILAAPNTDPGLAANLSAAKTGALVNKLYGYLTTNAWPVSPGATFAGKYAPGNSARAAQLAIDMIEYVRSAESAQPVVDPIRGLWSGGAFQYNSGVYDTNSFFGNARRPYITEIGVSLPAWSPPSPVPATGHYNVPVTFKVEVYLPPHCGIGSLALTSCSLSLLVAPGTNTDLFTSPFAGSNGPTKIASTEASPATLLPGGYGVITRTYTWTITTNSPATTPPFMTRPAAVSCRAALVAPDGVSVDIAPLQTTYPITCPVDPAGTALTAITSVEADDPVLNKRGIDWHPRTSGNSFGSANAASTLGAVPPSSSRLLPQQDTDAAGRLTDVGMVFPATKGAAANPAGLVQSVGELGYVHTGVEVGDIRTASGVPVLGAPWRTVRLQPEQSGSTDLPDWLLLDLFCAPQSSTNPFVRPNPQSWGGQVNVNGRIAPFGDAGDPSVARTAPLQALLLNATNATTPSATTVGAASAALLASNICFHVLSPANGTLDTAGRAFGTGLATNAFFTPAQIAEVSGVADGGEDSETLLRQILGTASSRGNVFSVYSVGQALKQDRLGLIHVLSESRLQCVVERWDDGSRVTLRPVFVKTLHP